ncbi:hypothetical protein [Kerstersia similis]|uniref:hypothetical protein n=1 Tax=Kerstersia similis TaxID=206505 RepID=UPI0039F0F7CE
MIRYAGVTMHQSSILAETSFSERCPLDPWRRLTERGDRALARGDGHSAMTQYRAALSLADACFPHIADAEAGASALFASHRNLARLYERLGHRDMQIEHVCVAYEILAQAAHDGALAPGWREASVRWGQQARGVLAELRGRFPEHERLLALTLH